MKDIAIKGQRLFDYLVDKNITQKGLSNLTGIQESAISDICNDKRAVGTRYLEKICRTLNISADYLLGLSDVAERDAKIDNIGINDYAYKALCVLYGDNDISKATMNTFLSVFSANDGELGKKFAESMFDVVDTTSSLKFNRKDTYNGLPKVAMYNLQMLFANEILSAYKKNVYNYFQLEQVDFDLCLGYYNGANFDYYKDERFYYDKDLTLCLNSDPKPCYKKKYTSNEVKEIQEATKEKLSKIAREKWENVFSEIKKEGEGNGEEEN